MDTPLTNQNLNLLCKRFLSIVSLLFFGFPVLGQSITISEGTYLYVKSSSEIYTDTIVHVKSKDLIKLGRDTKNERTEYIAKKSPKKELIPEETIAPSVERKSNPNQNYKSFPEQNKFISYNFSLVSGISQQTNFQKIVNTDTQILMITDGFPYKNKEIKGKPENLKSSDKNISYIQRPPPKMFLYNSTKQHYYN